VVNKQRPAIEALSVCITVQRDAAEDDGDFDEDEDEDEDDDQQVICLLQVDK